MQPDSRLVLSPYRPYRPTRAFSVLCCLFLGVVSLSFAPGEAQARTKTVTVAGFEQSTTQVTTATPASVDVDEGTTMVIIENAPIGAHFDIRSKNNGIWSSPIKLENHADEGPDGQPESEGSDGSRLLANIGPIWIGADAEAVEVSSGTPTQIQITTLKPDDSVDNASATQVNGARVRSGQPTIKPRSAWAAGGWATGTSGCENGPSYADSAKAVVIHHTVTTNSYSASQVPGIIRGIYHFHVNINKWCDIGYNFVVDKYGTIWEARSGGTDKAVVGGHAKGFNTDTSGIALLGQHQSGASPQSASPSSASKTAIAKLAAWKLSLGDIMPTDRVNLTNRSTSGAQKLASNTSHNLPAVLGHQDLGHTSCPGNLTMPFVRQLPTLALEHLDNSVYVDRLSRTFDGRPLREDEVSYWQGLTQSRGHEHVAGRFVRSSTNAGIVVDRLYRSAFGRSADAAGRAHWVEKVRNGYSYEQLAMNFYASAEISLLNPRDADYVTQMYRSVLGRDPDAGGLADWVARLGSKTFTRHQVARLFIQSSEGRAQRVHAQFVAILQRPPDSVGLRHWSNFLWQGDDFDMAAKLAASVEYRS